jgi:hypothetical protein
MTDAGAFSDEVIERLRTEREVRIETRRPPDGPVHKTIIWVVVDNGRAYVRTYLGARSRWYREAMAAPNCTLWLGKEAVPVRVVPATDPAQVEAVSRGFEAKYPRSQSTAAMVRDEVLETTLELLAR